MGCCLCQNINLQGRQKQFLGGLAIERRVRPNLLEYNISGYIQQKFFWIMGMLINERQELQ